MDVLSIKFHNGAVRRLLNSEGVRRDLERRGAAMAGRAGFGFMVTPAREGKTRARVAVVAVSPAAKAAEANYHVLTQAIDAGRK